MRSEAKKTFQHGFDLTEQEFRRIYDALLQQISHIPIDNPLTFFEVKFQNGVIAEPANLDEIFALENIGSSSIVRLEIYITDDDETPHSYIRLKFMDVDSRSESGEYSIEYTIGGDDRDWVFITSSQLDERIARIKRFTLTSIFGSWKQFRFVQLVISLMMIVITVALFISLFINQDKKTQEIINAIDIIETRWKSGEINNIVNVFFELEREKTKLQSDIFDFFDFRIWSMIGIVVLLAGIYIGWGYYIPGYNFLWGDYVKVFEKRKTTARFILIGIILTIIISILANYISKLLGI